MADGKKDEKKPPKSPPVKRAPEPMPTKSVHATKIPKDRPMHG